jgi:hypothetical protein
MWTAPIDDLEAPTQKTQGLCKQLQGVLSGATKNMNAKEAQKLSEFINEFQDIFATKSDHGRMDRFYHSIDTGPIRQPRRTLPLAKHYKLYLPAVSFQCLVIMHDEQQNFLEAHKWRNLETPGLEVSSCRSALLNPPPPPTNVPQCKGILIKIITTCHCCVRVKYFFHIPPILKYFFHIPPILVVWQHTTSQTETFAIEARMFASNYFKK